MIRYSNAGNGGPDYSTLCVSVASGNNSLLEFRIQSRDIQLDRHQLTHLAHKILEFCWDRGKIEGDSF